MSNAEGRKQKAIRLLKQQPFEFIDHGKYRGALPENFEPKLGDENWDKATAIMAVIRSKPATWQWNADRLEAAGRLSTRVVKEGVKKLKEEGWIHHANIYDERHKHMTTFVVAFSSPIPEHQRIAKSRFTLLYTDSGWVFGYSRDGGRYVLRAGIGKDVSYTSVRQVYGHIGTVSITQTLKRAGTNFSDPPAAESETTQCDSPPPAPQEPEAETRPTARKATPSPPAAPKELSENVINDRKRLARELERLGEKRDDSEAAALAYEEFVSTRIIAELELPEKTDKPRRSCDNLTWVESNLLGMILLQMSSSYCWTATTALRLIRRSGLGFINFDDVRTVLFAFDWTSDRRSRKTLEDMTAYDDRHFDHNKGEKVTINAWARMVRAAKETYRRGILGPVLEQRNRLFPQNEDDMEVCHDVNRRVGDRMREICTGSLIPDQKNLRHFGLRNPEALALILSRCGRTEETQKMIDESKDQLETYLATDYAGILLYRSKYHLIPETMGLTLDGIKKRHHERVDMIQQRLSYHGVATNDIQPYI